MGKWDPAAQDGNPYDSPTSEFVDSQSTTDQQITTRTVELMRQTRPWALFVGIIGVVFGGLSLALALLGLVVLNEQVPEGVQLGLAAGVYFVSGITQILVGGLSIRYASRLGRFVASGSVLSLDDALEAQRSVWRTIGVIAAIMVGLMVLAFVVGIMANVSNVAV